MCVVANLALEEALFVQLGFGAALARGGAARQAASRLGGAGRRQNQRTPRRANLQDARRMSVLVACALR